MPTVFFDPFDGALHRPLTRAIEQLIAASGADAVAVGHLDRVASAASLIRPYEQFHAASTMKVCVLMELFHQSEASYQESGKHPAEQGLLSLDEPITIRNEFRSIVDGSPFTLEAEDDSEPSLYARIGETEMLIELARLMITHSSNLATNLLVERLGPDRVTAFMNELGAPSLVVRRGVEDGKAYRLGLNNTVTASGLTEVMRRLALGTVVSPWASSQMLDILLAQTHRSCIPAGLPPGTKVANKPGWNAGICHDTGIVFRPNGKIYTLTVLTRGLDEHTAGPALIAAISREVYASYKDNPEGIT